MPEKDEKKPILDPERELPAPHDMLIEAEEKDGKTGDSKSEKPSDSKPQEPSKKKTLPLWLLPAIAFLIILLAGGMYFLNTQKETAKVVPPTQPTPTVTPTPDPISTWNSYGDQNINKFSFKYPPDWTVNPGDFLILLPTSMHEQSVSAREKEVYFREKYSPITITWDTFDPKDISGEIISQEDIQLGSRKATKYVFEMKSKNYPKDHQITEISLADGGEPMTITLYNPSYQEIYDKVISSFILAPISTPKTPSPSVTQTMKACTMDAKICPDGSTVGRSGPNCEFAPCPTKN